VTGVIDDRTIRAVPSSTYTIFRDAILAELQVICS
jgi:hypothetical protein